jgi:lysozyme
MARILADKQAVLAVLEPIVMEFEGLRLVGYKDPVGIPTIGYGHTKDVYLPMRIKKAQAIAYLQEDMTEALNGTLELCPILRTMPAPMQAAIADFVFNLGAGRLRASTLRRHINAGQFDQVPTELRRWKYAWVDEQWRPLAGLIRRREAECTLWESGTHEGQPAGEGLSVGRHVHQVAGGSHVGGGSQEASVPSLPQVQSPCSED